MGMRRGEYDEEFDRGGFYDDDIDVWFDKNYKKFPDDFFEWKRYVNEVDRSDEEDSTNL